MSAASAGMNSASPPAFVISSTTSWPPSAVMDVRARRRLSAYPGDNSVE
jgi:hypothetical protein